MRFFRIPRPAYAIFIASFALFGGPLQARETVAVRPIEGGTLQAAMVAANLPETYCSLGQCIAIVQATDVSRLRDLMGRGVLRMEILPKARRVGFANATWDADTRAFDRPFPDSTDTAPAGGPRALRRRLEGIPD